MFTLATLLETGPAVEECTNDVTRDRSRSEECHSSTLLETGPSSGRVPYTLVALLETGPSKSATVFTLAMLQQWKSACLL